MHFTAFVEAQRIERAGAEVAGFEMRREVGRTFFFDYEPARREILLSYQGPLRAGSHLISAEVDAHITRDDRVWLAGPNGAGKTTLLKRLADNSTLPTDRLLYLPQELRRTEASQTLADLDLLSNEQKGRVLNLVAALGVEPARLIDSKLPSPGETRKLAMAMGM